MLFVSPTVHDFRESAEELQAILPLELLTHLESRSKAFTLEKKGRQIEVRRILSDGTAQTRLVPHEQPAPQVLPAWPEKHASNSRELLAALDDAAQVVAKDSVRFATDRLCLCGKSGSVIGTDGRQLLVLGKFDFTWTGQKLVPAVGIFGLKEFAAVKHVQVADAQSHVMLRADAWTFFLPVTEGRFPDFNSVIPRTHADDPTWHLPPAVRSSLVQTLDKLPGSKSDCRPVTLDLGKKIALRAKNEGDSVPTELAVPGSMKSKPITVVTDRQYLARALELGFDSFVFGKVDRPIVCRKENRTFVWVPLCSKTAIRPHPQAIHLDLAKGPAKKVKPTPVPTASPKTNPDYGPPQAPSPAPAVARRGWHDLLPAWTRAKEMIRQRLNRQRHPEWV